MREVSIQNCGEIVAKERGLIMTLEDPGEVAHRNWLEANLNKWNEAHI